MEKSRIIAIASNNNNKITEIKNIFQDFKIKPASFFTNSFNPIENGETFCENAYIKAKELLRYTDINIVLADDSGLEVFVLNNKPSVFSARYSKEKTDQSNLRKLLLEMHNKTDRKARFVCCMIAIINKTKILQAEEYILGKISESPYGISGFGYDPIFIPNGYTQTFAQLGLRIKNKISHRKKALDLMRQKFNIEGLI